VFSALAGQFEEQASRPYTELLAAMESTRYEAPAEKMRFYVAELEQGLSVIRVTGQILNMDERCFVRAQ
jgi:hypothetical protein